MSQGCFQATEATASNAHIIPPCALRSRDLLDWFTITLSIFRLPKPLRKGGHLCGTQNSRVTIGSTHTHSPPDSTLGLMSRFFSAYVCWGFGYIHNRYQLSTGQC